MKYLVWVLWFSCSVLVIVGLIGFFFFSGQVVDTAKSCADAAAAMCEAIPVAKGISAGKWALAVIGGVLCGVFAKLFSNESEK